MFEPFLATVKLVVAGSTCSVFYNYKVTGALGPLGSVMVIDPANLLQETGHDVACGVATDKLWAQENPQDQLAEVQVVPPTLILKRYQLEPGATTVEEHRCRFQVLTLPK